MDKLFFFYDEMLCEEERKLLKTDTEFLTYAVVYGKMYWFNDSKKRRKFITPANNNLAALARVYGAIFLMKDYDNYYLTVHSYYNNSKPYTNKTLIEDMFVMTDVLAFPFKMKNIMDMNTGNLEFGKPVECSSFVGNIMNKKIAHSLSKPYYKHKPIDKGSFIKLVGENNGKRKA